jgi:hypothetical protein
MKYPIALVIALLGIVVVSAQDKKPLPAKFLPPIESHGLIIDSYGCDNLYMQDSVDVSKQTSYWYLVVWAQYGKDHKKFWQKTYGTYELSYNNEVHHNGESAGSGGAIAAFNSRSYDFTLMNKACIEWGATVKATLKERKP